MAAKATQATLATLAHLAVLEVTPPHNMERQEDTQGVDNPIMGLRNSTIITTVRLHTVGTTRLNTVAAISFTKAASSTVEAIIDPLHTESFDCVGIGWSQSTKFGPCLFYINKGGDLEHRPKTGEAQSFAREDVTDVYHRWL